MKESGKMKDNSKKNNDSRNYPTPLHNNDEFEQNSTQEQECVVEEVDCEELLFGLKYGDIKSLNGTSDINDLIQKDGFIESDTEIISNKDTNNEAIKSELKTTQEDVKVPPISKLELEEVNNDSQAEEHNNSNVDVIHMLTKLMDINNKLK